VFEDGDVRIFVIATADDAPVPVGCLMPFEGAPGFQTAQDARTWLRKASGLPGSRRMLIARIQGILELREVTQPTTRLVERSRVLKAAAAGAGPGAPTTHAGTGAGTHPGQGTLPGTPTHTRTTTTG
jgi:hypothetical protein